MIAGFQAMEIVNIQTIRNGESFAQYIQSIQLFQRSMIKGIELTQQLTKLHLHKMNELISTILDKDDNNHIPHYIMALFKYIMDNVKCVVIDLGFMNKDFLFKWSDGNSAYGCSLYKSIYFDASNNIKWNTFTKLYKSLRTIYIQKVIKIENDDNGYKYDKSILMTDSFLSNILSFISSNKTIKWIVIHYPINIEIELNSLISKYSSSFNHIGFKLEIKQTNNPQMGSCKTFSISPK